MKFKVVKNNSAPSKVCYRDATYWKIRNTSGLREVVLPD
jgi:hypothetical protein